MVPLSTVADNESQVDEEAGAEVARSSMRS
jgi:hypothetical protein